MNVIRPSAPDSNSDKVKDAKEFVESLKQPEVKPKPKGKLTKGLCVFGPHNPKFNERESL